MKELVLCFVVFVLQTQDLKRLGTVFKYERMNSLLGLNESLCFFFFYRFLGECWLGTSVLTAPSRAAVFIHKQNRETES